MSTAIRGTSRVTVAGREYVLAPEFGALEAIESRLNVGAFDLLRRFAVQDWRYRDVYTVLRETARAGGKAIPDKDLGEYVLEQNPDACRLASEVLMRFFPAPSGGEAEPNPPAAATS